jgi:hypothetical protein
VTHEQLISVSWTDKNNEARLQERSRVKHYDTEDNEAFLVTLLFKVYVFYMRSVFRGGIPTCILLSSTAFEKYMAFQRVFSGE